MLSSELLGKLPYWPGRPGGPQEWKRKELFVRCVWSDNLPPDYGPISVSSVAQSRLTLCDPMDCSTPGCIYWSVFKWTWNACSLWGPFALLKNQKAGLEAVSAVQKQKGVETLMQAPLWKSPAAPSSAPQGAPMAHVRWAWCWQPGGPCRLTSSEPSLEPTLSTCGLPALPLIQQKQGPSPFGDHLSGSTAGPLAPCTSLLGQLWQSSTYLTAIMTETCGLPVLGAGRPRCGQAGRVVVWSSLSPNSWCHAVMSAVQKRHPSLCPHPHPAPTLCPGLPSSSPFLQGPGHPRAECPAADGLTLTWSHLQWDVAKFWGPRWARGRTSTCEL